MSRMRRGEDVFDMDEVIDGDWHSGGVLFALLSHDLVTKAWPKTAK